MPATLRLVEVGEANRLAYEAQIQRLGSDLAKRAYSRALNHVGRRGYTRVKRAVVQQSSIKMADVNRGTRFHSARLQSMLIRISATGEYLPLKYFGARSFSYGIRAKVWGRFVRYPRLFIIQSLGGNVFRNTGGFNRRSGRNNALEKAWGPAIPVEMLRDRSAAEFETMTPQLAARVEHELSRILRG